MPCFFFGKGKGHSEMKKGWKNRVKQSPATDYILIVIGTGFMGLAVNLFFNPASMVPGGFTGLAMMANRFSAAYLPAEIPVGVMNILFNIPLLIAAIRIRGWGFIKRTVFGALMYSAWMLVIPMKDIVSGDLTITALAGGALIGVGIGFILLGKGTTGGTDTVAALIQKKFPYLDTAGIYPILDGIIILVAIWVFGIRPSLYAVFSVILSGRVANWILGGIRGHVNQVFIISTKYARIAERIMNELNRGVTLVHSDGMYTREKKPMLLCAVSKRQTVDLRRIVYEVDEGAFVILSDAKDIRGEGFKESMTEEL